MSSSSPYKPITTSSSSPPPSTTPLSANLDFISRAKHRLYGTFSSRRPWRQFFDHHCLSFPHHFSDAFSRLKTNFSYFRMNFAMIVLLILFVSLLWHPISLIVFLVMMVAWLFLYFLRDEPLVVFGRSIDDRIILAVLSVLTVGFLLLTGATGNILIALGVGVGVVVIYSVFRRSDDLFLDEEQAAAGGLLAGRTGI
uniref:PRA1 family protein n=2 Tax=Chenopodium quinoa TaxID=63459 RepID=A0A803LD71_CHEQI